MDATLLLLGIVLTIEEFDRFSLKTSEKVGGIIVNVFLGVQYTILVISILQLFVFIFKKSIAFVKLIRKI